MPKRLLPLAFRLGAKMAPPNEQQCRLWTGYINPQTGYGQLHVSRAERQQFGFTSRTVTAPVAAATLFHGPRPAGLYVLHSCDVAQCLEPRHLRWGTQAENSCEAWGRGQQKSGEQHHQARHTDDEVRRAIARVRAGESAMSVARDVGLDNSTLSKWVLGKGRGRVAS